MIKTFKNLASFALLALALNLNSAQADTSASFSGGSVKVGSSGTACTGAIEGAVRYVQGSESELVGYWDFDENAGTTTGDSSGKGNSGTFYPSYEPAWSTGYSGSALTFDGSGELSQVPNSSSLNITGNLSIAFWFYSYNTADPNFDIVGKTDGGLSTNSWQYSVQTTGDEMAFFFCDGASAQCGASDYNSIATTSTNFAQDQWYHVVVTYDDTANDIQIYVNGVAQALTVDTGDPENSSLVASTEDLRIGWSGYTGSETDGKIDELRIYNRTLDSTDAAALYNGTSTSGGTYGAGYFEYCDGTSWERPTNTSSGSGGCTVGAAVGDGICGGQWLNQDLIVAPAGCSLNATTAADCSNPTDVSTGWGYNSWSDYASDIDVVQANADYFQYASDNALDVSTRAPSGCSTMSIDGRTWYLPTSIQLGVIYDNKDTGSWTGGDFEAGEYWSINRSSDGSSLATTFDFSNGQLAVENNQWSNLYVRCISLD